MSSPSWGTIPFGGRFNQAFQQTQQYALLGSHWDEDQRVFFTGIKESPVEDTFDVSFRAARACLWVTIHIQTDATGGRDYDPVTFVSSTRYDMRIDRVRSIEIATDGLSNYFVWAIPEFEQTADGSFYKFDGVEADDHMAYFEFDAANPAIIASSLTSPYVPYASAADTLSDSGFEYNATNEQFRAPSNIGSQSFPQYSFVDDTDAGMFLAVGGTLQFGVGGGARLNLQTGLAQLTVELQMASDGLATDPQYTFTNDLDTGLFLAGTNQLGITAGGVSRLNIAETYSRFENEVEMGFSDAGGSFWRIGNSVTTNELQMGFDATGGRMWWAPYPLGVADFAKEFGYDFGTANWYFDAFLAVGGNVAADRFLGQDGSVSAPTFSFSNDADTGMYLGATGDLRFTVAGSDKIQVLASETTVFDQLGIELSGGSSRFLQLTRTDLVNLTWDLRIDGSGDFEIRSTTDAGATVLNAFQMAHATGDLTLLGYVRSEDGSVSAPTFSFSSDPNTGVYLPGADVLGFATNGSNYVQIRGDTGQEGIRLVGAETKLHDSTSPDNSYLKLNTDDTPAGRTNVVSLASASDVLIAIDSNNNNTDRHFTIGTNDVNREGLNWTELFRLLETGQAQFKTGLGATPAISFLGDTNTGIRHIAADQLGFVTGGQTRLDIQGSVVQISGSASAFYVQPQATFFDTITAQHIEPDTNSTWDLGTNTVRWANAYIDTLTLTNSLTTGFPLLAPDGTAAAPSYSFNNNSDVGLYYTTDQINWSVNNSQAMYLNATSLYVNERQATVIDATHTTGTQRYLSLTSGTTVPNLHFDLISDGTHNNSGSVIRVYGTGGSSDIQFYGGNWSSGVNFATAAQAGTKGYAKFDGSGSGATGNSTYGRLYLYSVSDAEVGSDALGTSNGTVEIELGADIGVRSIDGAAATPSFSFRSDTDTGMYLNTSGDLRFSVGSSDRLELTSVMKVRNTGASWGDFYAGPGVTDHGYFQFYVTNRGTTRQGYMGYPSAGSVTFTIGNEATAGNIQLLTPGGQVLFPDGALSTPSIAFTSDSNTGFFWPSSGEIHVATNGQRAAEFQDNATGSSAGMTIGSGGTMKLQQDVNRFGAAGLRVQATGTDQPAVFSLAPSGTSDRSVFRIYNDSDTANVHSLTMEINGTIAEIDVDSFGTPTNAVTAVSMRVGNSESARWTGTQFRHIYGSAGTPSIAWISDSTTGLFGASGILGFSISGSERARFDGNGNLLLKRTTATLGGGNGDDLQIGSGGGGAGLTIHSSTTGLGDIQFADGTTGNASYRGLIRYGHDSDDLEIWTSATVRMTLDSNAITSVVPYRAPDGSAASPAFAFTNDVDTGMYLRTTGSIGFAVAGSESFRIDGGSGRFSGGSPAYHWYENDAAFNEKHWRIVASGGSLFFQGREDDGEVFANPTFLRFYRSGTTISYSEANGQWRFADGSAANPAVSFQSDPDTGMYLSSTATVAFASGGAIKAYVGANEFRVYHKIENANGTVGDPTYSFNSDTDTGMYLAGTGDVRIATAGADRLRVTGTEIANYTAASGDGFVVRHVSGTNNPGIFVETNEASNYVTIRMSGSTGSGTFRFGVDSEEVFRLDRDAGMTLRQPGTSPSATGHSALLIENATSGADTWFLYNGRGENYITWDETGSQGTAAATIFRYYTSAPSYNEVLRINRQGLRAQDGSAATPVYGFQSDTDTGMYLTAAGQLSFASGGIEQARMFTTQTSFYTAIEVEGFTGQMARFNADSATGSPYIEFQQANTNRGYIQWVNNTGFRFGNRDTDRRWEFYDASAARQVVVIDEGGGPTVNISSDTNEVLRMSTLSTAGEPFISFYQSGTRRAYIQYNDDHLGTNQDALIIDSENTVGAIQLRTDGVDRITTQAVDSNEGWTRFDNTQTFHNEPSSTANAIDWDLGNIQTRSNTGARTITLNDGRNNGSYILIITAGAGAVSSWTWPTVQWAGGSAPTLTTVSGDHDIISFVYANSEWYGMYNTGLT